jgi:hypothetical protein
MLYKIITPNPNFSGERAGVQIVCGSGITRDAAVASECRRMGYIIQAQMEPDDPSSALAPPSDSSSNAIHAEPVNDSQVGAHGVRPDAAPLSAGVQAKPAKRKPKEA